MRRLVVRLLIVLLAVVGVLVGVGSWRAADSAASHERLLVQLGEMEELLRADDEQVEAVSAWSVYEHVEHLVRANQGIVGLIEAGEPPGAIEPKTLLGRVVLLSGRIPRGKGQAPAGTVPEDLSRDELLVLLARVDEAARALDPDHLPDGVVGNHPVFGGFTAPDWLRLMAVHDAHHLAIIADIQAQRAAVE